MPPTVRTRPYGKVHKFVGKIRSSTHSLTPPHNQVGLVGELASSFVAKAGTQKTVSEGHPFASRSKGDLRDLGGDFMTTKSYSVGLNRPQQIMDAEKQVSGFLNRAHFYGHILPLNPATLTYPSNPPRSDSGLDALGATAIARCKPTNSPADAATFLGELMKDRIPDLPGSQTWKERTATARSAGSDFLNYEFGWLPLVSDVKKFAHAVRHARDVLRQYERDAGKVVRRRYRFPEHRETTEEVLGTDKAAFFVPGSTEFTYPGTPLGRVTRTVETIRNQWFSGAFTYQLPRGYDSRKAMDRYALMADVVYGASLTPDTLWELAPWSWAVDWFSNTGDVISNITDWATHGLVMHYGYIMEHTIVKHTYSISHSGLVNNSVAVSPFTLVTETKVRRRANPFGFGLTWDGLSPLQAAIAAAIGITR